MVLNAFFVGVWATITVELLAMLALAIIAHIKVRKHRRTK